MRVQMETARRSGGGHFVLRSLFSLESRQGHPLRTRREVGALAVVGAACHLDEGLFVSSAVCEQAQKEERVSYRTPRGQRAEGRSGSIVRKMTELMDHEKYVEKLRN